MRLCSWVGFSGYAVAKGRMVASGFLRFFCGLRSLRQGPITTPMSRQAYGDVGTEPGTIGMNEKTERMLCKCPHGHKLRGGVDLIGKSVRCPRCNEKFVFGYQIRESISDTAVMRILGAPSQSTDQSSDQCRKCGAEISSETRGCKYCDDSVGQLPDFFSQLKGGSDSSINSALS